MKAVRNDAVGTSPKEEDESLQSRGDEPVSELYIWGSK